MAFALRIAQVTAGEDQGVAYGRNDSPGEPCCGAGMVVLLDVSGGRHLRSGAMGRAWPCGIARRPGLARSAWMRSRGMSGRGEHRVSYEARGAAGRGVRAPSGGLGRRVDRPQLQRDFGSIAEDQEGRGEFTERRDHGQVLVFIERAELGFVVRARDALDVAHLMFFRRVRSMVPDDVLLLRVMFQAR